MILRIKKRLISCEAYNPSPQDFLALVVGPLPPVLISRYAKNHSPDDFCLRHCSLLLFLLLANLLLVRRTSFPGP